jgi:hypothetical protein
LDIRLSVFGIKSQQLPILVYSKRINLHLFLIIMNCCVTLKVFYVKQIKSLVTAIHFKKILFYTIIKFGYTECNWFNEIHFTYGRFCVFESHEVDRNHA